MEATNRIAESYREGKAAQDLKRKLPIQKKNMKKHMV
jgi:hypothetical protein